MPVVPGGDVADVAATADGDAVLEVDVDGAALDEGDVLADELGVAVRLTVNRRLSETGWPSVLLTRKAMV